MFCSFESTVLSSNVFEFIIHSARLQFSYGSAEDDIDTAIVWN